MKTVRHFLSLFLCACLVAYAQGNTFTRVRYNGGTVSTKVDPKDWDNQLIVTSDLITFKLKDGQKIDIQPKSVTSLSYGQEAHRRVGTMIALGILVAPLALFGLFHKTRLHFIGVEYATPDGKKAGLLLQGDKNNYRAILVALQSVTGAPVAVSAKEREYIPVGVTTQIAKGTEEQKAQPSIAPQGTPSAEPAQQGTIIVTSTPEGADVSVDGAFVGNTPATLKLAPGKHTIKVSMAGYKEWSREISVLSSSDVKLTATLEKQNP